MEFDEQTRRLVVKELLNCSSSSATQKNKWKKITQYCASTLNVLISAVIHCDSY